MLINDLDCVQRTAARRWTSATTPTIRFGADQAGARHRRLTAVLDWYRRDAFVVGKRYVDADGRYVLEYAGVLTPAAARALPGVERGLVETPTDAESVMVFRRVVETGASGAFYTHSRSDADRGYGFVRLVNGD